MRPHYFMKYIILISVILFIYNNFKILLYYYINYFILINTICKKGMKINKIKQKTHNI